MSLPKYALLDQDGVVDSISYDPDLDSTEAWIKVPENVFAGFKKVGSVWVAPEAEPVEEEIPFDISDRQFFQKAAIDGLITEQEALDAVGPGIIPSAMEALVGQLPAELQFDARMKIKGATRFETLSPTVTLIQALFGWTDEEKNTFFIEANKL